MGLGFLPRHKIPCAGSNRHMLRYLMVPCPERAAFTSPGLRRSRYPGLSNTKQPTPTGLRHSRTYCSSHSKPCLRNRSVYNFARKGLTPPKKFDPRAGALGLQRAKEQNPKGQMSLARRKPTFSSALLGLLPSRYADRMNHGLLSQEPPRITRLPQSPLFSSPQALPSRGA